MKAYQLRANRHDGEETVPALSREEAEFFSIYKGEPGNFAWVADFSDPDVAYQHASKWQAEYRGQYRLDTTQFDAVMNSKPKFPEGFIEWHGGECPVDPNTDVQVILRQDARNHPDMVRPARNWTWPHHNWASDILAYKVVKVAEPAKPIGHPNAEAMAQYAEDSKTSQNAWKAWEWARRDTSFDGWRPCSGQPLWTVTLQYRRKPAPSGDPTHCPFCGGADIAFVNGITACLEGDPDNSLDLDEYQCRSESCGRSFWS